MSNLISIFLQIDWSDIQYAADDMSRTVYSFPVHIRILFAVTLVFIMIILILLAVVLSSRIYKTGRAIKRAQLQKKYQQVFRNLLFGEPAGNGNIAGYFDEKDLNTPFHRETIMNEIIHLHENFTGETADRLEEIFMRLNFHFDSLKKLRSKNWYIVAKGMRELALMNVRQALPEISGYLNSNVEILRMESRIAIMKLSDHDPLAFLDKETGHLTGWDTANIYSMLTKMPEKMIPDFSKWLNSGNKDVVLLCIRMIGAFRQQDSGIKLVQLLSSEDERIRLAAVKALGLLNASGAERPIVDLYPRENLQGKTEILKTLEIVGTANSAPFLESVLKEPVTDFALSIQAVRSLLALGGTGSMIVDKVFQQSNEQMRLIINHAKDRRL